MAREVRIINTSKTLPKIRDTSPRERRVDPKILEDALKAGGGRVDVIKFDKPLSLLHPMPLPVFRSLFEAKE